MSRPLLALVPLLMLGACAEENRQPTLDPIAPQSVQVGEVLTIELGMRDPDGDELLVSASPMPQTATIETTPAGAVQFVWAPLISDTGATGRVHTITFTVDDQRGGLAVRTIDITVTPVSGAPVFVGPSGYILNLSEDDDISFLISVKDDDSAEVDIEIVSESISGARFQQLDGKSASFYWRPDESQQDIGNYWQIEVEARDEIHEPVRRRYSVLLMNADAAKACPGTPPVVSTCEEPSCVPLADLSDAGAVVFRADAADIESDVREMTLHYATNNPGDPGAYEGNTVNMQRCDPVEDTGCPQDPQQRYFIGLMPNPAATATQPLFLYYFITAEDNDDFKGQSCDHTTRLPKKGHFTLATYPKGWKGGCKDDIAEPNNALADARLLEPGLNADLRACNGNDDWYKVDVLPEATIGLELVHEARHGALALTLFDADGTQIYPPPGGLPVETALVKPQSSPLYVKVAVPEEQKGADQTYGMIVTSSFGNCPNDALEPNDTAQQARFLGDASTTREVVVCPGDRDWFSISAKSGESVLVDLDFQHAFGDLDMVVYGPDGQTVLGRSETADSDEQFTLHSGEDATYYIEVRGFQGDHNTALMAIEVVPTLSLCFEDGLAPNQSIEQSLLLPENTYYDLLVCPNSEDWFRLDVNAGEQLEVLAVPIFPEDTTLQLEMFSDAAGEEVIGTPVPSETPGAAAWRATVVQAGSLRWRVRTPGAFTSIYHMAFGVTDGDPPGTCSDDRFSPTNSPEDALTLENEVGFVTRLKVCPGGEDWFRIKAKAWEEMFVYVFGFPDEEPLTAELYRQDSKTELFKIGNGESTTDGVEIRHLPEENDTYLIVVKGQPGAIHHYDLVIGLE